jgi:glycerol-3-phosphate acyltransferase PlsX
MGGEGGAKLVVPAALQALQRSQDLTITLVGDRQQIEPLLSPVSGSVLSDRCRILHADAAISDEDLPRNVLRSGQDSSLYKAVELVQSGQVNAMVSAGNTGALLMIGRHLLKTISGIQKPAIVASIPGADRQTYLLDVGANPEVQAQHLFEFAVMGSVLSESLSGKPARVGLLNIGSEQFKGTDEVREAAEMLENCSALNYVGFIEANALFEGAADVVVCDGFVGNVTIKSSAGVAKVLKEFLAEEMKSSALARLSGRISGSLFTRLADRINPQRFNGASLLGLQGSIVKSHGNATQEGFYYAITQAQREAEHRVPQLIAEKVAAIMSANGANCG